MIHQVRLSFGAMDQRQARAPTRRIHANFEWHLVARLPPLLLDPRTIDAASIETGPANGYELLPPRALDAGHACPVAHADQLHPPC